MHDDKKKHTHIPKAKIANALTSVAKNHIVAVTEDIYDERLGKYQEEINKCQMKINEELKKAIDSVSEDKLNEVIEKIVGLIEDLGKDVAKESTSQAIWGKLGYIVSKLDEIQDSLPTRIKETEINKMIDDVFQESTQE